MFDRNVIGFCKIGTEFISEKSMCRDLSVRCRQRTHGKTSHKTHDVEDITLKGFTLGDARSFFGLTSKNLPLGYLLKF